MKAIKTLVAVSALATVAGAANATVWNIAMSTDTPLASTNGDFIINYVGTYDDGAKSGNVGGEIDLPGLNTTVHYLSQTFTMDPTTGLGYLNLPDSSSSNCSDNTGSACAGLNVTGPLFNNINFGGTPQNSSGSAFNFTGGELYTWTLLGASYNSNTHQTEYIQVPLYVCSAVFDGPSCPPPPTTTPIPTTAWLFGSGLIGLAGATRRRKVK